MIRNNDDSVRSRYRSPLYRRSYRVQRLELASIAMASLARDRRVQLHFITPGKPTENAFIESFSTAIPS